MSFAGKVVVVAGTSGIVGSGIARAFLAEDAIVVAPVRSKKSLASFIEDWTKLGKGELDVVEVDVGTESGAAQLADHVKAKYSEVDHAVSSIGAWWQGGTSKVIAWGLQPDRVNSLIRDPIDRDLGQVIRKMPFLSLLEANLPSECCACPSMKRGFMCSDRVSGLKVFFLYGLRWGMIASRGARSFPV